MRVGGVLIDDDTRAFMQANIEQISADLVAGVQLAGHEIQEVLRTQVRSAGLGPGLEKAWALTIYRNTGFNPAGLVYSKATLLHAVFAEGAVITAKAGRYLAIPTRESEALGFAATSNRRDGGTPGRIDRRSSRVEQLIQTLGPQNVRTVDAGKGRKLMIYRAPAGRGPGVSIKTRGKRGLGFVRGVDVPIFILIPTVRLTPRLDLDAARRQAEAILPARLNTQLARSGA